MARDDEKRKSFFEEDDEDQDLRSKKMRNTPERPGAKPAKPGSRPESEKLFTGQIDSQSVDQKIGEIKALMDQTHQLYQHYFNGIERRPPIEKARLLESRIAELQRIMQPTQTIKFKISQFVLQYSTFKELWERKLRDKERASG